MKLLPVLVLIVLAGCSKNAELITYVCEEPLEKYLELARINIKNDYEVDRSREVLAACPAKGFHRRYSFSFVKGDLASKQSAEAHIVAAWCNDDAERTTKASLEVSPSMLIFRFTYPWSTATGKYPRTEFRLNRNTLKGGFSEDREWSCRLEQPAEV